MAMPTVEFERLLDSVDKLSSEQKDCLRRKLQSSWALEFREAIEDIRADIPTGIPEEEIQADIERAIEEVRSQKS